MPKRTKEDCLEFIEELGSRFPDLSDDAVMSAYDEYDNHKPRPSDTFFVSKFSLFGIELLAAYEKGVQTYYADPSN